MSTKTGQQAESAAAHYLKQHGFTIIGKNWRTRWCEIDIIASKGEEIYLVEVKYRQNDHHGLGLDYITHKKQQQMHFAAEFWLATQSRLWSSHLAAIEVSGPQFKITKWLPDL